MEVVRPRISILCECRVAGLTMDFGTIYATVWLILAVLFLIDRSPTRAALSERVFMAFAMIVWPYFLPIFIYNAYKNRGS